jgi:hypothetical protein
MAIIVKEIGPNKTPYFLMRVDEVSKKAMVAYALLKADGDREEFEKDVKIIEEAK